MATSPDPDSRAADAGAGAGRDDDDPDPEATAAAGLAAEIAAHHFQRPVVSPVAPGVSTEARRG